uniref:hypothetical protein n=1 Tax=Klebsiella pneumoniae TaxID=573 RepID=UPI0015EF11BA|nr:hypothetical protein [Klebsiella pneumoniae]
MRSFSSCFDSRDSADCKRTDNSLIWRCWLFSWLCIGHCCKVSDEAAFCLIQRPYISKTLLTRRISPRGSP